MKKLVIIGGGFAGAEIARRLQNSFAVTLIDEKDYFEFTPGILRSLVYPNHLKEIKVNHKDYLKKAKFILGKVSKIKKDFVILKNRKKIKSDFIVISSGSRYESPIKDRYAISFLRGKKLEEYNEKLEKSSDIVIVGGGIVGVELGAEIITKYKDKKLAIIHSDNRLMNRNDEKSSLYVEKFFRDRNVNLIYNENAVKKSNGFVYTNSGKKIKCSLVFFCTGIKPNSNFLEKKLLDKKGFVKVNEFLQMNSKKNIFVCGDVASVDEEKTAQNAEKQAYVVLENLINLRDNQELKKYFSRKRAMVISLGKFDGIFEYKNFVLTGIFPALLKWIIEKKTILKYRKLF